MKLRGSEAGYSIVEVMVAMLILMIAILPMFKMFDVGLQTATRSGDYDRARAFAEKQAEIAQSVTFDELNVTYPKCNGTAVPTSTLATNCADADYPGLIFSVDKKYVEASGSSEVTLSEAAGVTKMIKTVIEVNKTDGTFVFRTVGVIADDD